MAREPHVGYRHYAACGIGALLVHWVAMAMLPVSSDASSLAVALPATVWLEHSASGALALPALAEAEGSVEPAANDAPEMPRTERPRRATRPRAEASLAIPAHASEESLAATSPPVGADSAASEALAQPASALSGTGGEANEASHGKTPGVGPQGTGALGGAAHGPGLLALVRPCAGYFPARARANHGEVQVAVDVDASGHAHASDILLEQPLGQGFGTAARDCARQLRFAPAVDGNGAPVPGHAKVKLSFDRSSAT